MNSIENCSTNSWGGFFTYHVWFVLFYTPYNLQHVIQWEMNEYEAIWIIFQLKYTSNVKHWVILTYLRSNFRSLAYFGNIWNISISDAFQIFGRSKCVFEIRFPFEIWRFSKPYLACLSMKYGVKYLKYMKCLKFTGYSDFYEKYGVLQTSQALPWEMEWMNG